MTRNDRLNNILIILADLKTMPNYDRDKGSVAIDKMEAEIEEYAREKVNEALNAKKYGIFQNIRGRFSFRRTIIKSMPLFIVQMIAPLISKGRIDNVGKQNYYRLYDDKKHKGAGLLMRCD